MIFASPARVLVRKTIRGGFVRKKMPQSILIGEPWAIQQTEATRPLALALLATTTARKRTARLQ